MTGRDLAVCLFALLTVISVAGLTGVLLALARGKASGTAAVVVSGASVLCGLYAAYGWAWWLATGVLR